MTFLLVAIFSQSTPSCLKVMGWKRAGGYVVMCRRLCGGGLLDYNVISWDWGTPIPIPIPSPSRLTINKFDSEERAWKVDISVKKSKILKEAKSTEISNVLKVSGR